jgi:hypothetical protein
VARQGWKHSFERGDSFTERQQAHEREPSGPSPQHPCARGQHCSGRTTTLNDAGEKVETPALCHATFCLKCRNQVERALLEIPELWVRLHGELGTKGRANERVKVSSGAPIPLRGDVDALLREHIHILASWDERVRCDQHLAMPDTQFSHTRPDHGRQMTALIRTLTAHLDTLLALPADAMSRSYSLHGDLGKIPEGCYGRSNRIGGYAEVTVDLSGADAGEEILRLRYLTLAKLGETRMRERLDVPCPDPACDMLMLERVQGSDYAAECRACGRLLTSPEYLQWVKLYANSLRHADLPPRNTAA